MPSHSKTPGQTASVIHPGAVRTYHKAKTSQAHPGVSPLNPVSHRNTSFQPLPRPLGLPPYHYSLADTFPDIECNIKAAGKMVFHVLGDSGGVQDGEFQDNVRFTIRFIPSMSFTAAAQRWRTCWKMPFATLGGCPTWSSPTVFTTINASKERLIRTRRPPLSFAETAATTIYTNFIRGAEDLGGDTGLVLKCDVDNAWGVLTLTIDEEHISSTTIEIHKTGQVTTKGDSLKYSAKAVTLKDRKKVPEL